MPYVSFIEDKKYLDLVKKLLTTTEEKVREVKDDFHKNVIDPFIGLFEMASLRINPKEWVRREKNRQLNKAVSNALGKFHQQLLGSVNGWKDLGNNKGVDLVCEEKKIVAEIKNKYNTEKGGSTKDTYRSMNKAITEGAYKNFTYYVVHIIPRTPERYNKFYAPGKTKGISAENNLIRQIDGSSFYSLVTNVDDALKQIYKTLPNVIRDAGNSWKLNTIKTDDYFKRAYVEQPLKEKNKRSNRRQESK
jgi:hypothetical protein